ncbi:hypothetical protein JTB14_001470 [Gonioctena quinquepunctata]|nr:hypothetical protein JTB14_001470 [Gonioctena quinquepunctata]
MVAYKRIAPCEPPMACLAFTGYLPSGYLPSARRWLFKGFAEAEWLASRPLATLRPGGHALPTRRAGSCKRAECGSSANHFRPIVGPASLCLLGKLLN